MRFYPLSLLTFLVSTLIPGFGLAQNVETLVISRNLGYLSLTPTDSVMVMGFTESLKAPIGIPGPTLEYEEGDSVALTLWNVSQGAPHTIHLHGLDVDQQNDGVPSLSFKVEHMKRGTYRFKAPHPGTYLYHCHVVSPIHVQAGMYGLLIISPKGQKNRTAVDGHEFVRSFSFLTSEIDVNWHTTAFFKEHSDTSKFFGLSIPKYDPQYTLVNGISKQLDDGTTSSVKAQSGANTLLRLANVGFVGNRYRFPKSVNAKLISTDGRPLPQPQAITDLEMFPGERYQVLLTPEDGVQLKESVQLSFFNLSTQDIIEERQIPVIIDDYSSVEDQKVISTFDVYPNPAHHQLNVIFGQPISGTIEIIQPNGLVCLTKEIGRAERAVIDTQTLSAGLYYCLINILGQTQQVRLVSIQ